MFRSIVDVQSVESVKRTSQLIARIKKSGRPLWLTVNGRAKVVVLSATSYQRLIEKVAEAEIGRSKPAIAALERLAKKYKLKKKGK